MADLSPLNYLDWWFAVFSILTGPMECPNGWWTDRQLPNRQNSRTADQGTTGRFMRKVFNPKFSVNRCNSLSKYLLFDPV
jgi:hypothetical protein